MLCVCVCVCVFIGVHLYNRPKSCSHYLYTSYNNPIRSQVLCYIDRDLSGCRRRRMPTNGNTIHYIILCYYRVHCGGGVVRAPEVGILESSGGRVSGEKKN